jgi:hypothetical protein
MVNDQGNPQVPTQGGSTTEDGQAAASSIGEDVWDEQRIEDALKILKEMHIQVSSCDYLSRSLKPDVNQFEPVTRSTKHDTKTHCTSNHQATITYVLSNPGL